MLAHEETDILTDLQHLLGRDAAEAPAACAPLDGNDGRTALGLLDALVALEVFRFDAGENFLALMLELQFFLLVLLVDFLELLLPFVVLRGGLFELGLDRDEVASARW